MSKKPGSKKCAPRRMSEGGTAQRHYKAGMADPRTGGERIAGLVNRVASGARKDPVRKYDDSDATRSKNTAIARNRAGRGR